MGRLEVTPELVVREGRGLHQPPTTPVSPVLYAFFRVADEVVDRTDAPDAETQRAELERIREVALGERETDDPVLTAFHELADDRGIADGEVDVFVDAMVQDIDRARYETYAEHHRLVRSRDYDVLTETPQLSRLRRGYLLARTWVHWRRYRDPEAAFYAVSAVSRGKGCDFGHADGVSHQAV